MSKVFPIIMGVITVAAVGIAGYDDYAKQQAIKQGIQYAIDRGIDPLAVRCVYAKNNDQVCITYAASCSGKNVVAMR